MKTERTIDRLYRKRARYYADFRDFAAQGGALEALKMPGEPFATPPRDPALIGPVTARFLKKSSRRIHDAFTGDALRSGSR
jgi:hypothetical protein